MLLQSAYPAPASVAGVNYPVDNPSRPSHWDVFSPAVNANAPASPAICATTSRRSKPSQSNVIYGDGIGSSTTFTAYSQTTSGNGTFAAMTKKRTNVYSFDASHTLYSAYAVWPITSGTKGVPWLFNVAVPELCIPHEHGYSTMCVVGNTISVYGYNLCKAFASSTSVTLSTSGGANVTWTIATGLTITAGSPYHAWALQTSATDYGFIDGTVVSYNSGTGAFVGTRGTVFGKSADSYSNWEIYPGDYAGVYVEPPGGGGSGTILTGTALSYVSPCEIRFTLPSMAAASYNLWAHGATGGIYGWCLCPGSTGSTTSFTVTTLATLGENWGANTYNVPGTYATIALAYAAVVSDGNLGAATILLASGNYNYTASATYGAVSIEGAGDTTVLRSMAGLSASFMIKFTGKGRLKNLKIDTTQGGTFVTSPASGGLSDMSVVVGGNSLSNVTMDCQNLKGLGGNGGFCFSNPNSGSITGTSILNCTLTGWGIALQTRGIIKGCTLYGVDGQQLRQVGGPITVNGIGQYAVTDCAFYDLDQTDTTKCGSGRMVYNNATVNIDRPKQLRNICPNGLRVPTDGDTSGEKFPFDTQSNGGSINFNGVSINIVSATANTITLDQDASAAFIAATGQTFQFASICGLIGAGKGAGQMCILTGLTASGGGHWTYSLDRSFTTIPDGLNSNSIYLNIGVTRATFYANQTQGYNGNGVTAATLLNFFCPMQYDNLIMGNSSKYATDGIVLQPRSWGTLVEYNAFDQNISFGMWMGFSMGMTRKNYVTNVASGDPSANPPQQPASIWLPGIGSSSIMPIEDCVCINGPNGINATDALHDLTGAVPLYNCSFTRNAALSGGSGKALIDAGITVDDQGSTFTGYAS